eukprot:2938055-Rhodomonas_salina.3
MEDKDGRSLTEGSCLRPLRIKKPSAPIPPSEILEELRSRRCGYADDMRVCEQGYAQVRAPQTRSRIPVCDTRRNETLSCHLQLISHAQS